MNLETLYQQLYPQGRQCLRIPGEMAPDFSLPSSPEQRLQLRDYRGQPVVLMFFPAAASPVCTEQLALYNEILFEFQHLDAEILALSVDSVWTQAAFARELALHFPILSDCQPRGAVAQRYGVYRDGDGICERALFVVDGEGMIRWRHVAPLSVNPGAAGLLAVLETLRHQGVAA